MLQRRLRQPRLRLDSLRGLARDLYEATCQRGIRAINARLDHATRRLAGVAAGSPGVRLLAEVADTLRIAVKPVAAEVSQ